MDELARAFFGALYDYRIAVAIGTILGVVVLAVVAWRLGWVVAVRRHRRRTGLLIAIALVVGLPLTWYLASPIFLRSELVEPEVAIAVVDPTPSPASPSPTTAPTSDAPATPAAEPSTTPTPTPFQPSTLARGEFYGSDEFHFGSGTATIVEVEPGRYRLRLVDFSVRNGPDLFVYLSPAADGYADGALELGKLKATDGSFGYDLPAGSDPNDFASAVIWCKQFSHLFATAPLTRT